jgi:hypothetical protein
VIDRPENLALDEQFGPTVSFTARPGGRAVACDVFTQTPAADLTSNRAAAIDVYTQTGAKEHVLRTC